MRRFISKCIILCCFASFGFAGETDPTETKPAQALSTQPSDEGEAGLQLRLATYNIFAGRHSEQVLKNIQSANPDILLLQEVPLKMLREFARTLDMQYNFGPYHPGQQMGLGILVKGSIAPVKMFSMEKERNFALASRVQIDDQEILVMSVHLKSLPRPLISGMLKTVETHKEQAQQIVELVKETDLPAIVGGDLNTLSFTPAFLTFSEFLTDCAAETETSRQPSIFIRGVGYRIDHLFVRGPWQILSCRVSPLPGSDHRLVWSELRLPLCDD